MYLVLFTIIYCAITRIFNLNYALALGIYLIVLSVGKGILSKELKDVFNFRKINYMYKKVGFADSLMELISLMIIFINSLLIDYKPLSVFDFVFIILIFILIYRFLFWSMITTFKKFSIESSQ